MTNPDVFDGISNPIRRRMLKLLSKKELSIVSLASQFKISRTAITKHLDILFLSGLVEKESIGRETIYRLKADPLLEIKVWLTYFDKYWDEKLQKLKNLVESDD